MKHTEAVLGAVHQDVKWDQACLVNTQEFYACFRAEGSATSKSSPLRVSKMKDKNTKNTIKLQRV